MRPLELVSPDGDAMRPLEYLTGGVVSRRQIDRELDAYVTLGTHCLVHNEGTKGPQLASKVKYGVSHGMIGAINRFKCPFVGSIFRSASYTIVGLPCHISYAQFLGLPEMSNRNCMPKAVDLKIDSTLICKLPTPREWQRDILRDIVFTDKKNGVVKDDSKFYIARKSENGLQERDYSLTDKEYVGRHVEKFYEGHGKFKGETFYPRAHQIKFFFKHFNLGHSTWPPKLRKFGHRYPICKITGILQYKYPVFAFNTGFIK